MPDVETDLTEFWHTLAQLPTIVQTDLDVIVRESAREAEAIAPVRSGQLQRSIFAQRGAAGQSFVLGATARYAPFVFFGTKRMKGRPFLQLALARGLRQLGPKLAGVGR